MQVWVAQGAPKLAQQEQCTNAALAVRHGLFLSLRMDSATFHCQAGPEAPLIPHLTLLPTPHQLQLRRLQRVGKMEGPAASSAPESSTSNRSYF